MNDPLLETRVEPEISAPRKRFVLEGSRAFATTYAYANLLGNAAGRAIYDGGAIIASGGQLMATGPRFSYADYVVTSAVVDVSLTRMRTGSPSTPGNSARMAAFMSSGKMWLVSHSSRGIHASVTRVMGVSGSGQKNGCES